MDPENGTLKHDFSSTNQWFSGSMSVSSGVCVLYVQYVHARTTVVVRPGLSTELMRPRCRFDAMTHDIRLPGGYQTEAIHVARKLFSMSWKFLSNKKAF